MARLHRYFDEDDPAILDFQLAVTLRLKIFDDTKEKDSLRGTNLAMLAAQAGKPLEFEESREDQLNGPPEADGYITI